MSAYLVLICQRFSNMGLAVANIAEYAAILAQAAALGPTLRLFQVATLDAYVNATAPQSNCTASIPWSRASAGSAAGMSAMCYLFGVQALAAGVPIGLMANAWGGVAIQVYMSPASLATCTAEEAAVPPSHAQRVAAASVPHASKDAVTLGVLASAELAYARHHMLHASPVAPSCLYNSMLFPLLSVPVTAVLWYQGESNAGDPLGYQCLQRAMIADWRASWAKTGADPDLPFLFVQLSAWPTGQDARWGDTMRAYVEMLVLRTKAYIQSSWAEFVLRCYYWCSSQTPSICVIAFS